MKKIVINNCSGGFSLSHEGFLRLRELGCQAALDEPDFGEKWPGGDEVRECRENMFCPDLKRDDPLLVQLVEKMGDEASGRSAKLKIVEIPDDVKWELDEANGHEWIAEKHRTWD